jgi:hypothetical protein
MSNERTVKLIVVVVFREFLEVLETFLSWQLCGDAAERKLYSLCVCFLRDSVTENIYRKISRFQLSFKFYPPIKPFSEFCALKVEPFYFPY